MMQIFKQLNIVTQAPMPASTRACPKVGIAQRTAANAIEIRHFCKRCEEVNITKRNLKARFPIGVYKMPIS